MVYARGDNNVPPTSVSAANVRRAVRLMLISLPDVDEPEVQIQRIVLYSKSKGLIWPEV
jgi:hypothetical protein